MGFIYRELRDKLKFTFEQKTSNGLILSGVVGCGKTTLINKLIEELRPGLKVFSYSGDDIQFRQRIIQDTSFLNQDVRSQTSERALIFVDEVQKCEEVFDALKVAFDSGGISFIVSGSNPAYLNTIAKKRLQQRAEHISMLPLSLSELAIQNKWVSPSQVCVFSEILWNIKSLTTFETPQLTRPQGIQGVIDDYLRFGGLPLAHLAEGELNKLREIRLVVERGFDLLSRDNNAIGELVRIELAQLHALEFTYKNIMKKTRVRKREVLNQTIDDLINHGYLVKKRPHLFVEGKSSYLTVFSFIDPGMVTYVTGKQDLEVVRGQRVEGYVHARLANLVQNSVYRSDLGYYKPHDLDSNKNVRYSPGEIDFIVSHGNRIIPIEVKAAAKIGDIDTRPLERLIDLKKLPYGVVVYGGVPFADLNRKILYWPYWML